MLKEFIPTLLHSLKDYSLQRFAKDLIAGITIGIIALPLAMAFAIASGTTPDKGLFTAIIAGFFIALFGGSRFQISGPTGAFVVILFGIMQRTGYEGLAISTLIAAFILLLFGIFRIGTLVRFIPPSLIIGFTTGIAVLIFSSQVKDFFGFSLDPIPVHFIAKWAAYFTCIASTHLTTAVLSVSTLALIILIRKKFPRLPAGIFAIILATIGAFYLQLDTETIYSKFGQIPSKLPLPQIPSFALFQDRPLEIVWDAFAIAFLGGIESLLSCVIADRLTGTKHNSNMELVGQGIGNFASVLFGGIPATGAIARTAANVKNGGQTPIAAIIHALTVLFLVLYLSPFVSQIPIGALAAVLFMVAWNISEIPHFIKILRGDRKDAIILLTAFFCTIFIDIIAAIFLGMFVAFLLKGKNLVPVQNKDS